MWLRKISACPNAGAKVPRGAAGVRQAKSGIHSMGKIDSQFHGNVQCLFTNVLTLVQYTAFLLILNNY